MLLSLFSHVVSGRRPFVKDPELDYEIDSDEEWEEVWHRLICSFHTINIHRILICF